MGSEGRATLSLCVGSRHCLSLSRLGMYAVCRNWFVMLTDNLFTCLNGNWPGTPYRCCMCACVRACACMHVCVHE